MPAYDPNAVAPAGQIGPPGTEESSGMLTKVLVLGGLGVLGYYLFFKDDKKSSSGASSTSHQDDSDDTDTSADRAKAARASGMHTVLFVDENNEDVREFVMRGSLGQAISRAKKAWRNGVDRALIYPGDRAEVGIDAEVYRAKNGKFRTRRM